MSVNNIASKQDERVRERLKMLRQKVFRGNNAAFARASEIDPSTLHRALSGDTRRVSTFVIESVIENVEVAGQRVRRRWVEDGEGPMLTGGRDRIPHRARARKSNNGIADEGEVPVETARAEVVKLDMTVGAGDGGRVVKQAPIARYTIDYVPLPELRGRCPQEPFLTRVIGNSMETEFSSGDQVVVEPYPEGSRRIVADAIYVIRIDEEFQIKQVEYKPGRQLICKPINPRYNPFEIDLTDESIDFEIIGRVWGKFKRY